MYRYDYILRLIERLGHVLRTLRDRLLQRQLSNEDLRADIQAIAREAGLDIDFARRLDPGTLVAWLAPIPEQLDAERVWLMAELLHVEALAARGEGDNERAAADLRRALALFACIPSTWRLSADAPTAGERVTELHELLAVGRKP